ncbi:hypothetical protein C8F01DRAFT_966877, partial [Mycena amicta]
PRNPKKPRAESIPWAQNPDWVHQFTAYLTENDDFCRKLVGDSVQGAMKEKRSKAQGKEGKEVMFGPVTRQVF